MKNTRKAFTLVELIIVAVILSILATVGFISYEEYLVDTRDSKRLAQLAGLRDGLRLGITKGQLPLPDDNVEIRNNTTTFLYQGYAGENVLESISYSEDTIDPFDGSYYTYLLSRNRKDFQILGFLEKYNPDIISNIISKTYANDYSQRYPQVMGKKLGIVLEQETNIPLQELPEYTANGYMDLQDTTTNLFDAYITDLQRISGKENDLIGIIPFITCKKILESGGTYGNGIYNINPSGLSPFEVYCDMEMDGGGWTLVARSHEFASGGNFGWLESTGSIRNDDAEYSLGMDVTHLAFDEILATTYTNGKEIDLAISVNVSDRNYINTSSEYTSSSNLSGCQEIYPTDTEWENPCEGTSDVFQKWGYFQAPEAESLGQNIDHLYFFYRSNASPITGSNLGLSFNGYTRDTPGWYGDFYGDPEGPGEQGMIFVR